jgi:hypothetical protein
MVVRLSVNATFVAAPLPDLVSVIVAVIVVPWNTGPVGVNDFDPPSSDTEAFGLMVSVAFVDAYGTPPPNVPPGIVLVRGIGAAVAFVATTLTRTLQVVALAEFGAAASEPPLIEKPVAPVAPV